MLRKLFARLDKFVCAYLGIEREYMRPNLVQLKGKKLSVTNTVSFKRHSSQESWEDFSTESIKHTNAEDREKLGVAIGKAIAKNLVISFEEPPIDKK